MKGLYCGILLLFSSSLALAQNAGDYRSIGGSWNLASSWETFNGTSWVAASAAPAVADGVITISAGTTINVTTTVEADQIIVDSDAILNIQSGGLLRVFNDAGGDDLIVTLGDGFFTNDGYCNVLAGGTLENRGQVSSSLTNLQVDGMFIHLQNGGTIPLASWNQGSWLEIQGITNTKPSGFSSQTFYNLRWNSSQSASISLLGELSNIANDFEIINTGSGASTAVILSTNTAGSLSVGGDLTITGTGALGIIQSQSFTLTIGGDLTISSDNTKTLPLNMNSIGSNVTITVGGNVIKSNTGGISLVNTVNNIATANSTIDVTGDFTLNAGVVTMANGSQAGSTATGTLVVGGDLVINGGSFTETSNGTNSSGQINFAGTTAQQFTSSVVTPFNNTINFLVANPAVLNIDENAYFIGLGTFTLQAGATLGIASPDGLAMGTTAGNIRVSGVRDYQANGNIIYNGSTAQNLGNEWGPTGALNGIAVNLEIANSNSSGVTNNITGSTSLVGNLTLTSNPFHIGNANTLIIQSNYFGNGGTIGGLSSSNLTFSGSGTVTGTLDFADGARTLQNFTIDRTGTISLGTDLTISTTGVLAFTSSGSLDFDQVNGQTLTINGNITQTGSGGLASGSAQPANLVIGGSGSLSALPFCATCGTMELNNLTLSRGGTTTYPWNSTVRINGLLDLTTGTLAHSSGLIMTGTSTLRRASGTSVTLNAPNADPSYDVSYVGTLTTGLELPANISHLNNLTIGGDVTLDKAVQINGDLNINSGTFNAAAFDVTHAGDLFAVNGGTFTMNASRTIVFSKAGSTTMSGTTIGGTQFGNLTINVGTTVAAPNGNINISGTWTNLGSFSPNGGTVTFNGGDQSIDGNGQPFNNIVFASGGIKTLAGVLDVNGTLTINNGVQLNAASDENTINIAGGWVNAGTFTASGNTVIFDGTSPQTITETGSFYNLQLAGSGTKTLGAAMDVDNDLVIGSGVTFNTGTSANAITIGGDWTNNGTFTAGTTNTVTFNGISAISGTSTTRFRNLTISGDLTAPTAMQIAGNWTYTSGTFNANTGTVTFDGSANQSISPGTQSFYNVVIAGASTKTIQANTDINGNLTLTAATFNVGTNRTVTLAGNFDASGGGILNAQAGLFVFDGASQTITPGGEVFYDLQVAGTGTKTLAGALDVNGSLSISSAFAAGANSIAIAGDWNTTGTFTSAGQVTFDGGAQNIRSNGSSFSTIIASGSGTKTLQDALDVNAGLTVTTGLDVSATNYAVTVGGDWNTSTGTFNARTGTVTLDGAAQNITSGTSNFHHLVVSGSSTKTLQDVLDVNGNLTISTGATLSADTGNDIEIAGSWTNNGGFTAGTAKVTFDGGGISDVNGSANTLFNSIDVTGTTQVEIETAHSLAGTLALVGTTSEFDADGSTGSGIFTLVSTSDDPTADARIAALSVPANFTGEVTVQRYMSQESMPAPAPDNNRLYRYISSPVANASVSEIQTEIPITGPFAGASSCTGCDSSSPSMYDYDETIGSTFDDGWVAFPSASNSETLAQGEGYGVYVRGNLIPSALWDVRGPIFSGNMNLPVTYTQMGVAGADGFNLVGNPYPSAIDWNLIHPSSTNIANAVYIRDNANGRYTIYVNGVGSNGGSKDIAMGQGFWVEATGDNPVLPLTEDMKSSASTSFFRINPPSDLLRIQLVNGDVSDETVIRFHASASDLFDSEYDAWKLQNAIFNLSSVLTDDHKVAINTLGSMDCGREVKLDISNVATGQYDLSLSGLESFSDQVTVKLVDNFLGQVVDAKTTSVYGFSVDTDVAETFGTERFKVIFEFHGSVVEPEIFTTDVCKGTDASIEISNSHADVHYAVYSNSALIADIGTGNGSNLVAKIPAQYLNQGENTLELRAVSTFCSQVSVNHEFTVRSEELPQIINAKGSTGCLTGVVTLTASGGEEGSYRWYEAIDDLTPVAGSTGSEFTTPVLEKTRTYYVAAVNYLGCEGPRVEVKAEVLTYEPVVMSEADGKLVSSYETGNQWYLEGELIPGATAKTFTPTESGTYTVEVAIGQCTTSAQQVFLVTANEEAFSNGKLNVYPNPVKDQLVIESRIEQVQPPMIFDQTGKSIGEIKMVPSENGWTGSFDFSGKTKGLYILKVMEQGVPRFKRIIKE